MNITHFIDGIRYTETILSDRELEYLNSQKTAHLKTEIEDACKTEDSILDITEEILHDYKRNTPEDMDEETLAEIIADGIESADISPAISTTVHEFIILLNKIKEQQQEITRLKNQISKK